MTHVHENIQIHAVIDDVWPYFTDSTKIAEWLMPNTFQMQEGAAFTMDCPPGIGSGDPVECEIREISPPKNGAARLIYSWVISEPRAETVLEINLRQVNETTHVDIVHSGWPKGEDDLRTRHEMGWAHLLDVRLRGCFETPSS
ncbi:SRPBCC family protein [Phaeobacter sp. C3_T13_0]|uniref:SRPBCC family protein n=1 Tax=Phaeobacter cretensis TaxID=3342641 RepID=UPI0039BD0C53